MHTSIYSMVKEAHKGQIYGNKDYFDYHIMEVVRKVKELYSGYSRDLRDLELVALMHDLLEDTSITKEYLEHLSMDDCVIDAVVSITKLKRESRAQYLCRVGENFLARKVKIADALVNLENCIKDNNTKRAEYYLYTVNYLLIKE